MALTLTYPCRSQTLQYVTNWELFLIENFPNGDRDMSREQLSEIQKDCIMEVCQPIRQSR